ncbi:MULTISPECIES: DUF6344 domain-containing protein [unclassified Streptomyces]|uniref:DUF6344 domain-containing protein n=1 Tax=unclassified Streptomyces TaxID=2593676 RepID=UPI00278C59B7|nr:MULTISPECIES: DUF6344 domain-containing protein [unclassified Streptomyces]
MTKNRVMTLWTVIISAFIALFSALGLTSPATAATTTAPAQQAEKTQTAQASTPATESARPYWAFKRSLPPTMKQRIRAEAHGSSPSARHRPPADTEQRNADSNLASEALTTQK